MTARTELVLRIAELVGPSLVIDSLRNGWPALATLELDGSPVPIALFASRVGLSHRNRDAVERRFQNPAGKTALVEVPGRVSVLAGLWDADSLTTVPRPLLVTADATRRADGRTTRWSVFIPLSTLEEALATGWSTHVSDSGELIRCAHPALLPAVVAAEAAHVDPSAVLVRAAVGASGLLDDADTATDAPAAERARRAATSLVRDARFSRSVLASYDGSCAMCGLGLQLVQGAHIYPASAPGSQDEPWNGLALCGTHHLAFDRHLVAVRAPSMELVFRPDVLAKADTDPAVRRLIEATLPTLRRANGAPPSEAMFQKRYAHFGEQYDWLR
ncbi:HNH endonuclease [Cellulomonas sp. NS3]|uniref:HNH endonuclease n=1 Tax=Cellulomonas sp. NS3 TaxID=2973977 RepID=UPI002163C7AD|nr:HNH endonuclease [Cellulomonas sp. NS3]